MKGRGKVTIVAFSMLFAVFLLIGVLLGQEGPSGEPYRPLSVLSEVLARIQSDYVENPDFTKVTDGALHGMIESLDPYSSYLTPQEYQGYLQRQEQEASAGVMVSKRSGFVGIVGVLPGSPAQEAGLQAGDVVESLDGKSTRGMSLAEVQSRLGGAAGSLVTLSVVRERAAEPKPFALIRKPVAPPQVSGGLAAPGVGLLRVQAFSPGEAERIAARLQELRRSGAKKFILDLRDNASGEMEEGVAAANLFLEKGLIGYLSGQQYPRKSFLAEADKAISTEPLAVLVNRFTGGPAEILAGAILENHRGEVIGERTYGIGSIQRVIPMEDGSALILSIARYYTPGGKEIQQEGIQPSVPMEEERVFVPLSPDEEAEPEMEQPTRPTEDLLLKRAIELLSTAESLPEAA